MDRREFLAAGVAALPALALPGIAKAAEPELYVTMLVGGTLFNMVPPGGAAHLIDKNIRLLSDQEAAAHSLPSRYRYSVWEEPRIREVTAKAFFYRGNRDLKLTYQLKKDNLNFNLRDDPYASCFAIYLAEDSVFVDVPVGEMKAKFRALITRITTECPDHANSTDLWDSAWYWPVVTLNDKPARAKPRLLTNSEAAARNRQPISGGAVPSMSAWLEYDSSLFLEKDGVPRKFCIHLNESIYFAPQKTIDQICAEFNRRLDSRCWWYRTWKAAAARGESVSQAVADQDPYRSES